MRLFLVAASLLASTPAFATSVRFCIEYDAEFSDADVTNTEDFLVDNNVDPAAYGIRIQVIRNSGAVVVYDDYTSDNSGCTGYLCLSSAYSYRARVYTEAEIGTDVIDVRTWSSPSWVQQFYYVESSYTPPASGSVTLTYATSAANFFQVMASSSQALKRSDGGTSGETFTFHLTTDDTTQWDGTYISVSEDIGAFQRFVTIHEMGHAMGAYANGSSTTSSDAATCNNCILDTLGCQSNQHHMHEKEFQSAAANEGWAHAYAAFAFNDETESDCGFQYYKGVDWDLNTVHESNDNVNCEGGPMTGIDSADYMGDMCTGTLTNRGTEYDWLRFWWNMFTDQNVTYPQACSIWNGANPNNWNATDTGTAGNMPAIRLRDSANAQGLLTEWDAEDGVNGVFR